MWRRSLIDVWLIARFEVLRAIRSWSAFAMILLYLIANVGGAWVFIKLLGTMETAMASQLHVAATSTPGAMAEQIRKSDQLVKMFETLVGDHDTAVALLDRPFLAVFQLWQGFVMIPFLAATASSEAIAADVRTRAIRFEAMRTGRPELVAGRLVGQIGMCLFATCVALVGVWVLGMTCMAGQDPFALATALLSLGLRAVVFAVPFAGLGVAASEITSSPAWARVLALAGTASTWVVYWVASAAGKRPWTIVADVVLPLCPQSALRGLWQPGGALISSSATCVALGMVFAAVGYARFSRRDL